MSEQPVFANHDAGIFIGLTSSPFGGESPFCDYLTSMIKCYKDRIRTNYENYQYENASTARTEFKQYFYSPQFYFIFGHFDIAVISLIDDFEFAVRTFTPYDPLFSKVKQTSFSEYFTSQVVVGPVPRFKKSIISAADDTFLRKINRFPLIGICQLKLNNGFVIGLGLDYLNAVTGFIKKSFKIRFPSTNTSIRYLVLGSYSWNELTLLVFSNSFRKIGDYIVDLREATYKDLMIYLEHQKYSVREFADESHSLIGRLSKLNGKDERQGHIFETTLTTFGFDMNMLKSIGAGDGKENLKQMMRISPGDKVVGETRYFTKAGHVGSALYEMCQRTKEKKYFLYAGKGNLNYPVYNGQVYTNRFIKDFMKLRKGMDEKHVFASVTSIGIEKKGLPPVGDAHYYMHDALPKLTINIEDIKNINDTMVTFGFPKILSFRILNLFTGYNQGIIDRILYQSFIELRPFVKKLQELLSDTDFLRKCNLIELCSDIGDVVDAFEKAYHNRLYLSEMLSEVTDINFDFKGGIQQIVSAFDIAYKICSSVFDNEQVFCYVGGDPNIFSTESLIGLNYLHIFQPELFACVGAREASISFISSDSGFLELEREFSDTIMHLDKVSQSRSHQSLKELYRLFNHEPEYITLHEFVSRSKYFRFIAADILSYSLTFMEDDDLFVFWYIRYFFILHGNFEGVGKINERQFIFLLLRILSVIYICKPQSYRVLKSCLLENSESDLYQPMLRLEKKWFPIIRDVVEKIWNTDPFSEYERRMQELVKPYLQIGKSMNKKVIKKIDAKIHKYGEPYTHEMFINDLSDHERTSGNDGLKEYFGYIQHLFYAYLHFIMHECQQHGSATLLKRESQNGKVFYTHEEANILFDQRGGIFVCEPQYRRKYFKWRTAMIASLWDTSMRLKLNYIHGEIPITENGSIKHES